jgi:hypothetical protein
MAHVTEEVRSPRDEVLSSALLYVRIPGFTIGTLCVRVSFHFEFFSSQWIYLRQHGRKPICIMNIR